MTLLSPISAVLLQTELVLASLFEMNNKGWHYDLARAWVVLYQNGEKHLNKFVDTYIRLHFKLILLLKIQVVSNFMANAKISPEILNQTGLTFSPASFDGIQTFLVTRVETLAGNLFNENNLSHAKFKISENDVTAVLRNLLSPNATLPANHSSLIEQNKDALKIRLASLLAVAGLNKWPSEKKTIAFEGNSGKIYFPYTKHINTHDLLTSPSSTFSPACALFYLPHYSLLMLWEREIGLNYSQSLARIHFPKYGVFTALQWPGLLHLREEHVEEWPATTFIHSIQFDSNDVDVISEGGVDVFSEKMTVLFEKLKRGETPTTPRSTYEVCLYVLLALRDMIRRLSGSVERYFIEIDIYNGKLMS